jgi:flagellar protein FlaJ
MLSEVKTICNNITNLINDIDSLNKKKEDLVSEIKTINQELNSGKISSEEYKKKIKQILKGRAEQKQIDNLNELIKNSLDGIKNSLVDLPDLFKLNTSIISEAPINIKKDEIKQFIKGIGKKDKITIKLEKFTTYDPSELGKIANKLFQPTTKEIIKKYPKFFDQINIDLRTANIQILSSTYFSIALFSVLLSIIATVLFSSILILTKMLSVSILSIFIVFILLLIIPLTVLFGFYYYPKTLIQSRARAIKNEIPFALVHMASVAGSGARLIDIFAMLLESKEYEALSGEIKRIINYVNLLGYNLTTALKAVAKDTPSEEFKETLSGIVNIIETGGDLKQYLKDKSNDSLNDYKLVRKRYVETIGTYSEIYTAILIVAPLLFIVILTIISGIGQTEIAGVSINLIQKLGIFLFLPLLNIGFMMFISIIQPEM